MSRDLLEAPLRVLADQAERTQIQLAVPAVAAAFVLIDEDPAALAAGMGAMGVAGFGAESRSLEAEGAVKAASAEALAVSERCSEWVDRFKARLIAQPNADGAAVLAALPWRRPGFHPVRDRLAAWMPVVVTHSPGLQLPELVAEGVALQAELTAAIQLFDDASEARRAAALAHDATRQEVLLALRELRRLWRAASRASKGKMPPWILTALQQHAATKQRRFRRAPVVSEGPMADDVVVLSEAGAVSL